jgi:hypothetical protein
MLKATLKGRATTLSKTLLTAGLLGGAALSTLGAGSAQASTPAPGWDNISPFGYSCAIGGVGGTTCLLGTPTGLVPDPDPGIPGVPSDKKLTLLNYSNLSDGDTISFTKQTTSWEVNLNFLLDRSETFLPTGSLDYKMEITDPNYTFDQSQLSSLLSQIPAVPVGPFAVTKSIYSDAGFTSLLLKLTNNELPAVAGTLVASGPIGGSTIYVRDEWTIPTGSNTVLDAVQNNFTQATGTPGPLPLLGAGAAFGFSRRIRSRISSRVKGARLA